MTARADSKVAREAATTIPVQRAGEAGYVTAATTDVNGGLFAT